jgi:hypothetical protein
MENQNELSLLTAKLDQTLSNRSKPITKVRKRIKISELLTLIKRNMKTKKEITKMLLDKEISFYDVLTCFIKIKKINNSKKIKMFLEELDDIFSNQWNKQRHK